jgi:hypothetical protein
MSILQVEYISIKTDKKGKTEILKAINFNHINNVIPNKNNLFYRTILESTIVSGKKMALPMYIETKALKGFRYRRTFYQLIHKCIDFFNTVKLLCKHLGI